MMTRYAAAALTAFALCWSGTAMAQLAPDTAAHPPDPTAAEEAPGAADVQDAPLDRTTGQAQKPRSLDEIKKSGYIRILLRNNSTSFFIYRGHRMGFDYELGKRLAQQLGIRAQFVVPKDWSDIIPALLRGEGDVIAGEMTVTVDRAKQVRFAEPYLTTTEVIVSRKGGPAIKVAEDLSGKKVKIRKSSSYWGSLETLSARLLAQHKAPIQLEAASEEAETDDILDEVEHGSTAITVADALIAHQVAAGMDQLVVGPAVSDARPLAWAVRPDQADLAAEVDKLFHAEKKLPEFNILKRKYFEDDRDAKSRVAATQNASGGSLSPYDPMIQKASAKYGYDWRLVAAQIYQESRFDPSRKSWCGAQGLFQIMPTTAKELGIQDPVDPQQGIEGGLKYMARITKHFEDVPDPVERYKLALAGYNCGPGHVDDARRLLRDRGQKAETWEQVRVSMLELSKEKVHGATHYGYCRCTEPVDYVRHITERYDGYRQLIPEAKPK